MKTIITDISSYVIVILGVLYTLQCFFVFRYHDEEVVERKLNKQYRRLILLQLICYVVLYIQLSNVYILIFCVLQLLYNMLIRSVYFRAYKSASKMIANNMCFLISIGLIMLTRLSLSIAMRQFMMICIGTVLSLLVPYIMVNVKSLHKFAFGYGVLGIILLATVFVIGVTKNGSTNWVRIVLGSFSFSFQPSEFVKILFVFFVAGMYAKSISFRQIVITTIVAAIHVLILVLETDLGAALLFYVVYLVMLYVATNKKRYFFGGLLAGCVAAWCAYGLFSHVQIRVAAWQDPWSCIDGAGYQVAQSLFAIGTGGWFGTGLAQGMPDSIPVVESDFIFSAIAEELGLFFALCLLLICISCFVLFIMVAMRIRRTFYKLLAMGFGMCYIFQVFLAVGGVTKFIPSTGVTLPFISYGGSSILASMILFQLLQGLYMIAKRDEEMLNEEKNDEGQTRPKPGSSGGKTEKTNESIVRIKPER
ncbi:MAG: FtsW/RodA/SpoVE family cell cycle protein [Lachnospiraceae bacterium]